MSVRTHPIYIETENKEFLKIDKFSDGRFFISSSALIYDIQSETFYDISTGKLEPMALKARHPKLWRDWLSQRKNSDRF